MKVPLFQFPPFEVWYQNDCKWSGKIGEYYCEVHPTSWNMSGDETRYGCGIATSHVPLNVYVEPIARYNFFWDHQSIDDLREAYEKATSGVNAKWVRHIKEHYLVSSNESTVSNEKPPCYLEEKDNPYPLCLGRGFANCAHCCLWIDFDVEQDESRVNLPLTLYQLREMSGEPVWCEDYQCWGIVKCEFVGHWAEKPFLVGVWHDPNYKTAVNFEYDIKERGLTLYRYKPTKEECEE